MGWVVVQERAGVVVVVLLVEQLPAGAEELAVVVAVESAVVEPL